MFEMEFVSQKSDTYCGPASLKMLLGYYGVDVAFDTLIEECHPSVDGCTAGDLLWVGYAHGLENMSAWQTDAEDVFKQDRPAILYWRRTHFLVYGGLNEKDEPVLYNPGRGVYAIDRGSFAALFSGVMLCNGRPEDLPEPVPDNMLAKEDVAKGEHFIWRDAVWVALEAIPKGALIRPMRNCAQVALDTIINA